MYCLYGAYVNYLKEYLVITYQITLTHIGQLLQLMMDVATNLSPYWYSTLFPDSPFIWAWVGGQIGGQISSQAQGK